MPAAYAVARTSANLARACVLSGTLGAYAVSTLAARLSRGIMLSAAPATVSTAALDAVISRVVVLSAAVGTYAVTPRDMTLQKSGTPAVYELIAMPTTIAVTTSTVSMVGSLMLSASAACAIASDDAALLRTVVLAVAPASFAVSTVVCELGP